MGVNANLGWLWFFLVLLFVIVITYIFYAKMYVKPGTILLEFSMIWNNLVNKYVFTNQPSGIYGPYIYIEDIYIVGTELTIAKYNIFNNMIINTQISPIETDISGLYIIEEFGMLSLVKWEKSKYERVNWKDYPMKFTVCVKA